MIEASSLKRRLEEGSRRLSDAQEDSRRLSDACKPSRRLSDANHHHYKKKIIFLIFGTVKIKNPCAVGKNRQILDRNLVVYLSVIPLLIDYSPSLLIMEAGVTLDFVAVPDSTSFVD